MHSVIPDTREIESEGNGKLQRVCKPPVLKLPSFRLSITLYCFDSFCILFADVQQEQEAPRSPELSHAHHPDGWANLYRDLHGI